MAKTRRQYAGGAVASTLSSSVAASGVSTFGIVASTGWSVSTTIPFYVVVSPQTSSEEKMLVTLSSNTLTIVSRAVDGTSAASHASGASIYPVFTATDADEANELTAKYANRGSIVYQGSSTFEELPKGTQGYPLVIGANDPAWAQVGTTGIADDAITSAKILAGAVGADEIATGAVGSDELATNSVTTAKIVDLNVTTGKINDSSITLAKLASAVANSLVPVGTIAMFGGATAPTGWLLCDGTSTTGYTALSAIVGSTTPDLRGRFAIGDNSSLTLLATGGSTTIATTNLPAHSHANTATATTSVSISDPSHAHASTALGYEIGSSNFAPAGSGANWGYDVGTAPASTGITATASTTVTMSNAETGGAQAYYPPYAVVNYIIKHD